MGIETQIAPPPIAPAISTPSFSPSLGIGPEISLAPTIGFSLDTSSMPGSFGREESFGSILSNTAPLNLSESPFSLDRSTPLRAESMPDLSSEFPNFGLDLAPLNPFGEVLESDRVIGRQEALDILKFSQPLIPPGESLKPPTFPEDVRPESKPQSILGDRLLLVTEQSDIKVQTPYFEQQNNFASNEPKIEVEEIKEVAKDIKELAVTPEVEAGESRRQTSLPDSEITQILRVKERLEKAEFTPSQQQEIFERVLEEKILDSQVREEVKKLLTTSEVTVGILRERLKERGEGEEKKWVIEEDERADKVKLLKGKKAIENSQGLFERGEVYAGQIAEKIEGVTKDENSEANKENDGSTPEWRREFAKAGKFASPEEAWKALVRSIQAHPGVQIVENLTTRSVTWKNLEEVLCGSRWAISNITQWPEQSWLTLN